MAEANGPKPERTSEELRQLVAQATERAKFKNARLRRLKERNELYLASRRDLDDLEPNDDDVTKEL
jgi:hypothetical protein